MTQTNKFYLLSYRNPTGRLCEKEFGNVSSLSKYINIYLGCPKDYITSKKGANYVDYIIELEDKKTCLARFVVVSVIFGR